MAALRRLVLRLASALRANQAESDLAREVSSHLQLLQDDFERRGLPPADARDAARRTFGGIEQAKDLHRDARSFVWLDDARRDLQYGVRAFRRNPGFAAVAVLTLAVGIGANTAIFSLVNALVLRPLPVRHPEQLVELLFKYPGDPRINSYGWNDYERLRDQNHVFANLMAIAPGRFQVNRSGHEPEIVDGMYVTGNVFNALGLRPAIGRLIGPSDDRAGSGASAVAVISWSYWQSHFDLDPAILGRSLIVNAVPVTIIGVTPREFFGVALGMDPPLWMPVGAEPLLEKPSRLTAGSLSVALIARLKSGVTREQAQAEMRVLDRTRLEALEARAHDPQWRRATMDVAPAGAGLSILRERFSSSLLLMMATAGVLLVLVCINIASMLLARGAARRREISVRVALGAGRLRVVRQLLTESLLLAAIGGAGGVLIAYWGARTVMTLITSGRSPAGMPQPLQIPVHLDLHVLLFAAGATLGTGVLFGLVPAWHAFVSAPCSSLRDIGVAAETKGWTRVGQALVVGQVALSVILLTAAALFVRHLTDVRTVGLGFQPDSVLQVSLDWSRSGYTPVQRRLLYQQLLGRLAAIGSVRAATLAAMTPISGAAGSQFISVKGVAENPDTRRRVTLNLVAPRYFETLGTPLVAGRDFAIKGDGRPRVAIVNQAMAHHYFGSSSPLGREFTLEGQTEPIDIVGVVADAKYQDLHETPPRTIYLNALQGSGATNLIIVLRTDVRPTSVVPEVRRTILDVLPNVPVANISTLAQQLNASILPERLIAMLSEGFGMVAVLLAGIGLYGLLAYSVTRRANEIGIRVAIGATSRDVTRMVLTSALGLVIAGLAIGIPIALLMKGYASRALAMIAATQAEAPVTLPSGNVIPLMIAGAVLFAVAFAASSLPARRATQIDPADALRCE